LATTEGYGASVTFSSGFFASITDISFDGFERMTFDKTANSNLSSSSGYREFYVSALKQIGQMTVTIWHNPSATVPLTSAAETVTVTWPVSPGQTTAGSIAGTGFLTRYAIKGPLEGLIEATATIQFSGAPTYVLGS
jgi:hypothetical protein